MAARVLIRAPRLSDAAGFLAAVRRSRSLHRGWVKPPGTHPAYRAFLKRHQSDSRRAFLVILRSTGDIVGAINLGHIIHGPLKSAFVGYYAFAGFEGRGLMMEGLKLVVHHSFQKVKLHRLEANIQPENRASLALAARCGFVREGFSRRYLKIAGRWRDHERWAIVADLKERA
jgi:ribosomal-protein-alanine N-acetyltransferase